LSRAGIRQNRIAEEVAGIDAIVRNMGSLLLVLDQWRAPISLTRIWILYELFVATSSGANVQVALPPDERADLLATYAREGRACIDAVCSQFDARRACATAEHDRAHILDAIRRRLSRALHTVSESSTHAAYHGGSGAGDCGQEGHNDPDIPMSGSDTVRIEELIMMCRQQEAALDAFNDSIRDTVHKALVSTIEIPLTGV